MDLITLGAALNGSAEYVSSHFKGGSNIQIVDNPDGTQTINASGEVSSEDTVAREAIAEMKDGETLDSFGDVETALDSKQNTISDLAAIRSGAALGATAVQPETGKGLSTNDYTDAEKTKLSGIAEGAEVNVQADWNQTDNTADDYIKNKPTLGTAAAKNATDTYNATGDDVTTGKAVAAALATLPEPMVFEGSLGTGGTITTLPAASSSNKGYTYKVITAGTYASQSAKVGDTFISDGSAWVLIPSGDEPSGTVTNVAVANGGGLTVSGSPITTSGTITVGHSNSVTAKTSSSLKKFTYDANGHVTGSSELSTAESDALASGIDSTKVTQIETNKNNILLLTQYGGGRNVLSVSAATTSSSVLDIETIPAGTYKFHCDTDAPSNWALKFRNASNTDVYVVESSGSMSPNSAITVTLTEDVVKISPWWSGSSSGLTNMYLCRESDWTTPYVYQPYALSNAKLTDNVLWNTNNGVKNLFNPTQQSASGTGYTLTRNADNTFRLVSTGTNSQQFFTLGTFTPTTTGTYYLTSGKAGGNNNTAGIYVKVGESYYWAGTEEGEGIELTLTGGTTYTVTCKLSASQTLDYLFKPMIRTQGDSTYQPYALSNAELTTQKADVSAVPVKLDRYVANTSKTYTLASNAPYIITVNSYDTYGMFMAFKYSDETTPRLYEIKKSSSFDTLITVSAVASSSDISIAPVSSSTWYVSSGMKL